MINKNDYTEMEVLMNGTWQNADVLKTLEDGTCLILMGTKTSDGSYMQGGAIPADSYREIVVEPETKTVVKSEVALLRLFLEEGYTKNGRGTYSKSGSYGFIDKMWEYCGKEPSCWSYEPSWLEEVEVTA